MLCGVLCGVQWGVGAGIHAMELVHDDEACDAVMSLVSLLEGVYQLVSTLTALCLKSVAYAPKLKCVSRSDTSRRGARCCIAFSMRSSS